MLADTVNALYFATSVEALSVKGMDLSMGLGLGIIFSLLAGWLPARDAALTPPAQILAKGDWSPRFSGSPTACGAWFVNPGWTCFALPSLRNDRRFEDASRWFCGGRVLGAGVGFIVRAFIGFLAKKFRPFATGPVSGLPAVACSTDPAVTIWQWQD